MESLNVRKTSSLLTISITFLVLSMFQSEMAIAQNTNDILNLLIANKSISEEQADSVRAEYAIKQQNNLPEKKFQIDVEYRIRSEYRDGYQQLRNDTTNAAFFTAQRTRLNLSYSNTGRFNSYISIQDIRVWGQQDPRSSTASTLQFFEGWVEPMLTPELSIRVGRQRLNYDNQRLFSENNWRTASVSNDAMCIKYNNDKLVTDLVAAYNQNSERVRGTEYSPSGFNNYKLLIIHYLKTKIFKNTTLTLLNSGDGYQSTENTEKLKMRYTNGGRLEYQSINIYATIAAYYQWGKLVSDKKIKAWYMQPELKISNVGKFQFRLGAEFFSGTANGTTDSEDNSFVPLYGSGHSFNGSLDLITKFPSDLNGYGLINPYLSAIYQVNTKFDIRTDIHYFRTMENVFVKNVELKNNIGIENDWLVSWKPNSITRIEGGFSTAVLSEDFEILRKAQQGAHKLNPYYAYLSVSFKPVLFAQLFK